MYNEGFTSLKHKNYVEGKQNKYGCHGGRTLQNRWCILCSVIDMSIFSGQNISKLRDMKPLTNERKRNKRKTTIYVIKEFMKNRFFNAYILFFPCKMEIDSIFLLFLFLSFVKGFISLSLLIFWPEKIDMSMTEHKMHHLFCSVRPPLCYYVQVWVYHLQMSMKTNTNHANVCIPIYLELLYMQLLYWTIWLVN
jgi:hypothetical protein